MAEIIPGVGTRICRSRPMARRREARTVCARKLNMLCEENVRLKRLLAEAVLENAILRDRAPEDA